MANIPRVCWLRPILAALVWLAATREVGQAGTVYSASLDLTLTYQGFYAPDGSLVAERPDGLILSGFVDPLDIRFTDTLGNGTATASATGEILGADPFDLQVGEGLRLTTAVSGTTTNPGDFSIALAVKAGALSIQNAGTDDRRLAFQISFTSSVHAETDDPTIPAYGWVVGLVFTENNLPEFPNVPDPFDPSLYPLPFPFYVNVADTNFRPGSFLDGGVFSFDVNVQAGADQAIILANASHGDPFQPQQVVPEPGTAALAVIGLAAGLLGAAGPAGGSHPDEDALPLQVPHEQVADAEGQQE